MDQEKIGKFISERRKKKKITQKEFAELLGVTDKTVSRWENGHYLPDVSLFNDVCEILDIEVAELLKGEKMNKMEKKDVDETIDKIVDISKDEIKKKNKKVIRVSILIILLVFIVCGGIIHSNKMYKKQHEKNDVGEKIDWPRKIAIKEKEDGWVCIFEIMDYSSVRDEKPYYYDYDCHNFKYKSMHDFVGKGTEIDSNGNEYTYDIAVNHPSYTFNDKYRKDLHNITDYFNDKQFVKEIKIKDLEELELKYISKEDVLELYNKAVSSNKIDKFGKYPNLHLYEWLTVSMTLDNYTWYVGHSIDFGHISYISLELMIDGEYLSDLVKEKKATTEQKELYENIQEIEKHIIDKQEFVIPSNLKEVRPYSFLDDVFDDLKKYEYEIENE